RNDRPRRAAAREDRDRRTEGGGIVERARIDRVRLVLADLAAEDEAAAARTEIAHRLAAMGGRPTEPPPLAAKPHRVAGKSHEGNEARARRLLAIGAVAVTGEERLAIGLVAKRAAEAAPSINLAVAHDRNLVAHDAKGKSAGRGERR